MIPIVPAIATSAGVDVATAGFIAGLVMLGHVVGDIPSGWLVSKIGERFRMIAAGALIAVASIPLASSVVGAVGLAGAALMFVSVRRYVPPVGGHPGRAKPIGSSVRRLPLVPESADSAGSVVVVGGAEPH